MSPGKKARQAEALERFRVARTLVAEGNREQAVDAYLGALELDPELGEAAVNLGVLYGQMGEAAGALKWLQRGAELSPSSARAQYNLGVALAKRRSGIEQAIRAFEAAVALDPAHKNALYALAVQWNKKGDPVKAAAYHQWYQEVLAGKKPAASRPAGRSLRDLLGPRVERAPSQAHPGQARPAAKAAARPAGKPVTRPAERPATRPAEKPATRPAEKPATRPAEKPAARPAEKPAARPAEKPVTRPVEKPATRPVVRPQEQPAAHAAGQPALRVAEAPTARGLAEPAVRPAEPQTAGSVEQLPAPVLEQPLAGAWPRPSTAREASRPILRIRFVR